MGIHTAYRWRQQIVWGTALILAGCALLLDRAGIIEFDIVPAQLWRWWPSLLVISGLIKIIPPTTPRYFLSGLWEIFFAGWWYVSFNHLWGWGFAQTWPALVVACGLGMLARPVLDNIFPQPKELT